MVVFASSAENEHGKAMISQCGVKSAIVLRRAGLRCTGGEGVRGPYAGCIPSFIGLQAHGLESPAHLTSNEVSEEIPFWNIRDPQHKAAQGSTAQDSTRKPRKAHSTN